MLLNKLYRIRSLNANADGSGFMAEIELDPNHPLFEGHFPGNPILPGVCTVQIIRELLEQSVQKSLRMTKAGNIKYLGFVNPVTMPLLTFQLQIKARKFNKHILFRHRFRRRELRFAVLRASFHPPRRGGGGDPDGVSFPGD